jgi:predicted AlkP superfamily pyrophosphatase or phosphodiesterase
LKKVICAVIDGLTPSAFESAVEQGSAPTLASLVDVGEYERAVTVFPSLTPVCLASLVTGAYPDVHGIPHLAWRLRGENRLVEYGSSFPAMRAAGARRAIRDSLVNMNARDLSPHAVTLFEAVEDAGLVAAAVNIPVYRGRTLHRPSVPLLTPPVRGPKRFFYYSLFESDSTGAPLAWRSRSAGTIDAYAAAAGRWLVTRDGFDLMVFYLSDYDLASHQHGPGAAVDVLARCDAAIGRLVEAAGGLDRFLERYAIVVCSDHGQTSVTRPATLERPFAGLDWARVTASNRAGMVYLDPDRTEAAGEAAALLDGEEAAEVVLYREGPDAVARREGQEFRFRPDGPGFRVSGDAAILDHPDGLARAWAAVTNPNAGEIVVSATQGWEFTDLAGRHHAGGGSHGSLVRGDSEIPMLTVGLGAPPGRIVDVAPLLLRYLGVDVPAYAQRRVA